MVLAEAATRRIFYFPWREASIQLSAPYTRRNSLDPAVQLLTTHLLRSTGLLVAHHRR